MDDSRKNPLEVLRTLSVRQRSASRERAKTETRRSLGPKPKQEQFRHLAWQDIHWSVYLIFSITLMFFGVMMLAISATRVYTAAWSTFLADMGEFFSIEVMTPELEHQAAIVGGSMVMGAELLVILALTTMNIFFQRKSAKVVLYILGMLGLLISFFGNHYVSKPPILIGNNLALYTDAIWPTLEALGPPAGTLVIALVLERMLMKWVDARREAQTAFMKALGAWEAQYQNPEKLAEYEVFLNQCLEEAIREANGRGSGAGSPEREAIMAQMTRQEWAAVVIRELEAGKLTAAGNPTSASTSPETGKAGANGHSPESLTIRDSTNTLRTLKPSSNS